VTGFRLGHSVGRYERKEEEEEQEEQKEKEEECMTRSRTINKPYTQNKPHA